MTIPEMFKDIISQSHAHTRYMVKSYVGGRWIDGMCNQVRVIINPATGRPIGEFADVLGFPIGIYDAAKKAQEYWHHEVREQEKEKIFRAVADFIDRHKGVFALPIIKEGGKVWKWAYAEVQEVLDTIWHYHGELSRVENEFSRCQLSQKNSITTRDPYGVILAITPWNFPLAVPSWKIFASLVAGNAIVVKDSEQTPTSVSMLVWCLHQALQEVLGIAAHKKLEGLVQVVHGNGETVGKELLESGLYQKVAFTGGSETGKYVAKTAGGLLKPCHVELGGHAAMIVMDDFNLGRAVEEAVMACNGDTGQRCVSLRAVILPYSLQQQFLKKYIDAVAKLRIGDPANFETDIGPLSSKGQYDHVNRMVMATQKRLIGRTYVIGNCEKRTRELGNGYYYFPTVFTDADYGIPAMDEEIFGPVLCLVPIEADNRNVFFEQAIIKMNHSKYGLSNSICTKDIGFAMKAIERVKTGILYIGRGTTGAELNKFFGGVKNSGWGREGKGIDDFTTIKQVYIDSSDTVRMAQAGDEKKVQEELVVARHYTKSLFG